MNSTVDNSREFLSIYNELDEYMRRRLRADNRVPHKRLIDMMVKKDKTFNKYKDDLSDFARLRNAIVHNPYEMDADPIAEPHDYIVTKYKRIKDEVIKPKRALDIAVKRKDIFSTSPEGKALDIMEAMDENAYAHVPVMEQDRVTGVFSTFTVFSYLVESDSKTIDKNALIKDFSSYTRLEKYKGEYFIFVPRETLVSDIEELFHRRLEDNRRLVMVFITDHGYQNEKLLGIVTAWDVAGNAASDEK